MGLWSQVQDLDDGEEGMRPGEQDNEARVHPQNTSHKAHASDTYAARAPLGRV